MIVRFFKTGHSCGEAPVNYLLRTTDHEGNVRGAKPEILEGNPDFTIRLINECSRVHKYASGVLAFRPEEQPTRQELFQILDRFRETIAPGISPEHYHCLFVLHHEARDRNTGLRPFHVHFVVPMIFLAGESPSGMSLAGKRFNPHPPGVQSQQTMALFTAITNHEHGWKQVVEQPLRLGIDSFWRKVDGQSNTRKLAHLEQALTQGIKTGEIGDRDALISFMEDDLGCTITRQSDKYVSVRFPGSPKAIRLRGKMFEAGTNYAREFSTHSPTTRTVSTFTVLEYDQAKTRLSQLLAERHPILLGVRPKQPSTRIRKENCDGQTQANRPKTRSGRNHRASGGDRAAHGKAAGLHGQTRPATLQRRSGSATGDHRHSEGTDGRSGNQRNHSEEGRTLSTPTSTGSPQPHEKPKSQSVGVSGRGRPIWGRSGLRISGLSAAEIDEEIRKLSIALDDASDLGQKAIKDDICELVGRRNNLPKPK